MEMTKINIQNEANVNAEGKHVHGRSIPVVCIDEGRVFVSIIDAAGAADTQPTYMSRRLYNNEICTIKGKRYCYLSRLMESSDMMLSCLRDNHAEVERRNAEDKRLEAKRKADEEDARRWRDYQAELEMMRKAEEKRIEEERKAKERHDAAVTKAENAIKRHYESIRRLEQQYNDTMALVMQAEKEYEALTGKAYGVEDEEAA